jgi:hypothetical protein
MPGIVDDLVAPEVARVVGDNLIAQQHDDAFGMGAHQHHPAGGTRIDAVAIMIGHDQASGAGPDGFLDEPVEGTAQLHQACAFFLEHLPDGPILELRVLGSLGVGDALIFQPRVQLGETLHPRLRSEELVAQIANLVLDLTLLPSRGWRAGHRLDQVMRAHLQEAPIISTRLADEDRFDRRPRRAAIISDCRYVVQIAGEASMEHPLRVEEFSPSELPPSAAIEPAVAEAPLAATASAPLPALPNLPSSDVLFLRPSDPHYADYLPAANKRKQLSPALRAVCKTKHAVAIMVDWARTNQLSFAVRCGGHSYEGFSQSVDVVIDVRGLNTINVDKTAGLVTAGSGVSLFQIYQALAAQGLALQAGSCPTVGISGHLMGGGHGLLARSHGLTCDSLQQINMVDSQARALQANAGSEPDLYWACRGGGGGSFGIATQFMISAFPLQTALVFGVSWKLYNRTPLGFSRPGRPGRPTPQALSLRS